MKYVEELKRVLVTAAIRKQGLDMSSFADKKAECGTTKCIAGHAGSDKFFQEKGLRLSYNRMGGILNFARKTKIIPYKEFGFDNERYHQYALGKFFGITDKAAKKLFYGKFTTYKECIDAIDQIANDPRTVRQSERARKRA